ncbi:MAG: DNA mismatch repair protein MutS [Xanthobacteraceae bacterium]|nr:MAG: DNA mismatch repair protein MutS [Xanthobacteraceae bacterium]
MTRLRPPPRRRALSDEERALWETVVKDARPIKKKPRAKPVTSPQAAAPPKSQTESQARPAVQPPPARVQAAPVPPAPKPAGLDRRQRSRIARGHLAIDARIDLHGMTQAEAHGALIRFIRAAREDGAVLALVITGKGRSGEGERGVLRRQVPHWLAGPDLRALVIGFEEAHIGHGGAGALYVRLRRARASFS